MKRLWTYACLSLLSVTIACKDSTSLVNDETNSAGEDGNENVNWDESAVPSATLTNRAMIASYNTVFQNKDIGAIERLGVLVSWRWLSSDPEDITFDIYRKVTGGDFVKLNEAPIVNSSNYKDLTADVSKSNEYKVCDARTGEELCSYTFTPEMAKTFYRSIPLKNTGLPENCDANDAAIGDLDGDGEYEIVLKRLCTNQDNTGDGIQPGSGFFQAYKLDGTLMWQIDMGINIRQGPHYTPFIVYDLDGDGKAELAFRSSEGTVFGDGTQIGDVDGDGKTDYRDPSSGMVLAGPEFISLVDGETGKEIARSEYIPRGDESTWFDYWGDNWGNRIDRFLMAVGHFGSQDGRASLVICRGYYSNWQAWALHFTDGELKTRWKFNTYPDYPDYTYQGNHNLAVGDVDHDGKDEIVYGSCCLDHDGKGLYNTLLGHGDALHLGKFDPNLSGLQVVACHEGEPSHKGRGVTFRDAATGIVLWYIPGNGDVARCMVGDIDPESPGCEVWTLGSDLYSCKGTPLNKPLPTSKAGAESANMAIWWDGTLNRQVLDHAMVTSYLKGRLLTGPQNFGSIEINGTKANPCFYGDIWGDWREEIVFVDWEYKELRIFTTDFETNYRFHPLMDDHVYRLSAAHQNIGYNQPTHTGFYLGSDLERK